MQDAESRTYWEPKNRRREWRIAATVCLTCFAITLIALWSVV